MSISVAKDNYKFSNSHYECLNTSTPLIARCASISESCWNRVASYVEETGVLRSDLKLNIYPSKTPFSMNAQASLTLDKNENDPLIFIGPLLLIEPKKLPLRFKINDFIDDKLEDKRLIDDLITWINSEYFKINELSCDDLSEEDRNQLKKFLIQARDPELFEKMVEFTFAHEISHHVYEHPKNHESPSDILGSKKFVFSTLVSAGLTGTLFAIVPKSGKCQILFGVLGLLFGGAVGITLNAHHIFNRLKRLRSCEKEADLMAVKSLKDTSGAVYDFQNCIQLRNYLLTQKSESDRLNYIRHFHVNYWNQDHPTDEERLAYIEASENNTPVKELGLYPSVPFRWPYTICEK